MSDDKPPPFTSIIDEDEPAPATAAGKLPPDPDLERGRGLRALTTTIGPENAGNSGAQKEDGIPAAQTAGAT